MARGKKAAKELSPEEKLQQALVPVEEQPYLIPENWCWVRLGKLYEINPKVTADNAALASFVPMDRIESGMTGRFTFEIQSWEKARKNHTQFADGDVAFAKISPFFENQKSMIVQGLKNGIGGGTTELIILRQAYMNQKYTFLLISTEDFVSQGKATYSGTVGQQRISMDFVREYPVPVPPLPEQYRIVSRIESLFAKLDEAKEKAQAVVDGFELRKSAILHKAFTGELTERWRKEHGVRLDSWINTIFKSILDVRDGTHDSPEYVDVGYALVTSKNLKDGKITDKNLKYISQDDYNKINARSKVDIGDILFAMIGTIGKPVVIKDKPNYAIKNVALFKNIKKVNPYFVKYYLETKEVRDKMDRDAKGSTQRFVSLEYLRNFPIPIPTEAEQIELVERVDNLLEKEQQAKEAAEAVLSQIDTMKKSILARVFRGELGTNDPTEDSAVELIKAVL